MNLPGLTEIESAAEIVYGEMPPTPQYRWPMLCDRLGTEVWVKHENQTPVGAFKIRGGLNYFARLARTGNLPDGVMVGIPFSRGSGSGIPLEIRVWNTTLSNS